MIRIVIRLVSKTWFDPDGFVSRAPPVEGCFARSSSGVAQLLYHKLQDISSPSFEPPTSRFIIIFPPAAPQRGNSTKKLKRCAVAQHLALDLRSPKAANFFASCFDDRALGFSIFFLSGRASASFSRRTRWWARCLPPFFASRPLMGASAACVPLARLLLLLPVRVATREGPFSTSSTRNQTAVGVQNSPTRPLLRVRPTLR